MTDPFAAWAQQSSDAIVILDAGGGVVAWNPAAEGMLAGNTLMSRLALAEPFTGLLPARYDEPRRAAIAARLVAMHAGVVEVALARGDGTEIAAQLAVTRFEFAEDTYVGLRIRDVSRDLALENEITRLATFPELIPAPILELDADGAITYANVAATEVLALADGAKLWEGALAVLGDRDHASRRVGVGGVWYEQLIQRIAAWKSVRLYAVDVTARKLAEDALEESRRNLEVRVHERTAELELQMAITREAEQRAVDANRAKSTFLANMSHELRTPLNAVLGYTELLLEESTDTRAHDDLFRIRGAGEHLLSVISDILDLSKIEAGRLDVTIEAVDVRSVVDEVVVTAGGLAARRRNALVVDVAPDAGVVRADRARLRQVLLNLIGNSAKFTEVGRIGLSAVRVGDEVRFIVSDTGIGMDPADVPRLFQPFTQADGSTTRRYGGTGLGLAICRELTQLMAGTIAVETAIGNGSAFTVTLPGG